MAAWNPLGTSTPIDYFRSLVASDAQFPLLEAAASLAQVQHPQADVQAVLAQVDDWLLRLRRRLSKDMDPIAKLRLVNRFFFEELGFAGNVNDYYSPDNSFLHCVIESRRGIPISLAVLWLELAQGLDLNAQGVGFPGHFLVKVKLPEPHVGLIVLDPFTGQWLGDTAPGLDTRKTDVLLSQHLQACPPRRMVLRMLLNLQEIYRSPSDSQMLNAVQQRILIADQAG
jgi:regulator of sirC expression with transglutaminase-like and TPR domain